MSERQKKKKIKIIISVILIVVFTSLIGYSGYQIYLIQENYGKEAEIHNMIMEFKPGDVTYAEQNSLQDPSQTSARDPSQSPGQNPGSKINSQNIVNRSIADLIKKYPDAMGWITVSGTKIDYPFARYKDNDYYLHHDINGKTSAAGTIFLDYRCALDFSSQNTIIYGHHMKNGSMFGTLKSFENKSFFDKNKYGTIYLPQANLKLEIFAYLVIKDNDQEIYSVVFKNDYFSYIKKNARNYRDIGVTDSDRIVTLSTCAYDFKDARMVLLARVA